MDNKAYKLIFTILRNIWATLLYGGILALYISFLYANFTESYTLFQYVAKFLVYSLFIYAPLSYLIGMLTIIVCGLYEVYDFNKPFFYINRGQVGDKKKLKPQNRKV